MKVYCDFTHSEGESAVALGNFDGLHKGHQKVILQAAECAKRGLEPTVLTFSGNTCKNSPEKPCGEIITMEQKISLLERMGIKQLYVLPFISVKDMTAEEFVTSVLSGVCKAKETSCGFNFTFGRGGTAGSGALAELCARRGIESSVAGAVISGGKPISSTRIRRLIAEGRVGEAAELLGRPFCFVSPVVRGNRIGSSLGTPTANQKVPPEFVKPKYGVYASRVYLNGKYYCGVTDIGLKPTVGSDRVLVETWMPDYAGGDLYGKTIRTEILKFLRPEKKFSGLGELKKQILINAEQSRDFFKKHGAGILNY